MTFPMFTFHSLLNGLTYYNPLGFLQCFPALLLTYFWLLDFLHNPDCFSVIKHNIWSVVFSLSLKNSVYCSQISLQPWCSGIYWLWLMMKAFSSGTGISAAIRAADQQGTSLITSRAFTQALTHPWSLEVGECWCCHSFLLSLPTFQCLQSLNLPSRLCAMILSLINYWCKK